MDELYGVARRVMLDALEALGPHRDSVVVVGAHAIYLQVGEGDLPIAPYTTDADLALDPDRLGPIPPLELALEAARFDAAGPARVGVWIARRPTRTHGEVEVQVDLLVPDAMAPPGGRRAARLPGHHELAARRVHGIEGALRDRDHLAITALEEDDLRAMEVWVAGAGGLLVAKLHKINDRAETTRANDKDAVDVLRILRGTQTEDIASRIGGLLRDPRASAVTSAALDLLKRDFARGGQGVSMCVRALEHAMDRDEVRASVQILAGDLLGALSVADRRP